MKQGRWQFWIDRGGTFTDIVARRPDGALLTRKLLSDNPGQYQDAVLHGIRQILGLSDLEKIPANQVETLKLGTTVGTNALLEGKGEPTALMITQGFADAPAIGYQNRPEIFALKIEKPQPLYDRVIEVKERLDAQGRVIVPLDLGQAQADLEMARKDGIRALAIVLMHGYRYPHHEQALANLARSLGFSQVSTSHQTSPLIKLVARADTTMVDAYLSPCLDRYTRQILAGIAGPIDVWFMQSHGGLAKAHHFRGKDSVLSGPAGGLVAAATIGKKTGLNKIITFDMGGTSTDVAHFAGELERSLDNEIAGLRLQTPMLNIHTVAAGGGSLLKFDGMRYRVGPESAGAVPGPLCYRKGTNLTVTDANLLVGKIQPHHFPKVFGPGGDQPLDFAGVQKAFAELARQIQASTGQSPSPEAVAEGFLEVAVENMAAAIKVISVQRGYDLRDYVLFCFGAAGGQHACRVAERLGIRQVFLHPFAGVLSAYGMGLADFRQLHEQTLETSLAEITTADLDRLFLKLEEKGRRSLIAQGIEPTKIDCQRQVLLRYQGTDSALAIPFAGRKAMSQAFEVEHKRHFGFVNPDRPLVVATLSVEVIGHCDKPDEPLLPETHQPPSPAGFVPLYSASQWWNAPLFQRSDLQPGQRIDGPALVIEPTSTTVIEPGWQGLVNRHNHLLLNHRVTDAAGPESGPEADNSTLVNGEPDPVRLEIFNKQFMAVAEQMGYCLKNTAHSVNIKERLDYSCALFDCQGQLVANAPHIPVHLGSMGECVRALLRTIDFKPGEVWLSNSPYHGGTHLPDLTVVTPVFDRQGNELLFLLASRGHHADIGGKTPGSMPADSRTVEEEGVWTAAMKIVSGNRFLETPVKQWLASGPWPARSPDQNLADLKAQIAANAKGARELEKMITHWGLALVQAYMRHIQNNAAEAVGKVLTRLKGGSFRYRLDNDAEIAVSVEIDRTALQARIDFSGTSPQQPDNFNAPAAVCKAAVLYVFRTLVGEDIPLNDGCLMPLDIVIPEGSLLNPRFPAAVVAGNVETSQYIVDALYGALGVLAASQGTMNNFTFGDHRQQYYETLCGGAGAGRDFDGADAVHTHMTNSRLTDPEVLENRFPVRVEAFAIRHGSGGRGRHRGGHGVIRKIRFLEPMTAALLSSHRRYPPFGLAGGLPGSLGKNWLLRADGVRLELGGCAQLQVKEGDAIVIETPGGGGYGTPASLECYNRSE